ncbi:MAG: YqeG family HAD IIIA-type phosphatase [Lachnospiraceae bacterium]|nr:YqeG family HAD IIIA-type phosphatase [Lachnospiraceae bacterium]
MIYPKEEFGSAYEIPYEEFYKKGYRAIIFDIDNTLVPHGAPADQRAQKLCGRLRELGFQICFLSNNNTKRVAPFAETLGATYISNAGKPFKKGYQQAAARLQVKESNILFVGDQVLTDIIGANRAGYYSILVGPVDRKEGFFIVMKRWLEDISIFFYRRSRNYKGNKPNRAGYEKNIPEIYR